MTVAVVGGAAIGVAGSIYASNKASKAAKKTGKMAADADQAALDFQKERYNEWRETYGPIEDQLASYYETLSPTLRITQGLEAYEKEKNIALENLQDGFAQRGIDTSGIQAQTDTTIALSSAEERARIRASAPMEVAKEKLGFLQVGLGQDPSGDVGSQLDAQARNANSRANIADANTGRATTGLIDSITNLGQVGLDRYAASRKKANEGVTG